MRVFDKVRRSPHLEAQEEEEDSRETRTDVWWKKSCDLVTSSHGKKCSNGIDASYP